MQCVTGTMTRPLAISGLWLSWMRGGAIRGVAIVGRPVARELGKYLTLEVNRVATDGCPNACSALYGAARRQILAHGWTEGITYILESETGASLKASGWVIQGETPGGSWDGPLRPRVDHHPTGPKTRWGFGVRTLKRSLSRRTYRETCRRKAMIEFYSGIHDPQRRVIFRARCSTCSRSTRFTSADVKLTPHDDERTAIRAALTEGGCSHAVRVVR